MSNLSPHLHIIHIFEALPSKRPGGARKKSRLIERLVLTDAEFQSSNLRGFVMGGFGKGEPPLLGKKKRKPVPGIYSSHYAVYDSRGDYYELGSTVASESVKTPKYVDRLGRPVNLGRSRSVPTSFFPYSAPQRKAKKRAAATLKRPHVLPIRTPCKAGFGDRLPVGASLAVRAKVAEHVVAAAVLRFRNCDWGSLPKNAWPYNDELTFHLAALGRDDELVGAYPSGLRGRDKTLFIAISPHLDFGIQALLASEVRSRG